MSVLSSRLGAFVGRLGLAEVFGLNSNEDTRRAALLEELTKAQNIHDIGAAYFIGLIEPDASADKTQPLEILEGFFRSYGMESQVVRDHFVPIKHNKSFEIFYHLEKAGFKPLALGESTPTISSDDIFRNTVGVAMHDLQKYAGMDHIDCDPDQLRASADVIHGEIARYKRQYMIENPQPNVPKV